MNEESEYGPDDCYVCGTPIGTPENGYRGAASFSGTIEGDPARVCRDHVDALDEEEG